MDTVDLTTMSDEQLVAYFAAAGLAVEVVAARELPEAA